MNEPSPYYETPKDAPSRVRLYHGDCREILPLVAPPSKRVIVLADPPYGVGHTKKSRATRDLAPRPSTTLRAGKNRRWKTLQGDTSAFDPSHLLAYTRLLVWGWNHFGDSLSPTPSVVVWDKRDYVDRDDNADGEIAWTNLGGPARIFRHFWRGALRASEKNDGPHLHPTQKPEAFYRWLFAGRGRGKPTVNLGDLVVAPYLGSGPEIAPTMELGLDFIGIDVEEEYLKIAIAHRIEPGITAILKAGKQLDIWAAKPRREEQLPLGGLK